jgi:hypothetical protein
VPDQNYPNNNLEQYQLNSLWGGAVAGQITPEWLTFINGWVRSCAKLILKFLAVPWSSHLCFVQEAMTPGDVLAIDLAQDASDLNGLIVPYIGKYATIKNAGGMPLALGVAVEIGGPQWFVTMAGMGPIEARYTGLPPGQIAGTKLTVDLTANKLRPANPGEDVLAYATPKGCVLFLGTGRAA